MTGDTARLWAFVLTVIPLALAVALEFHARPAPALMIGLAIFMIVFAINSAVHSYLILAYSEETTKWRPTSASTTWPMPAAGFWVRCCPA